ncbi:MAG: T9SS type A sorting domain-containing protein, partial [Candidatus Marinimicrobia bacterium]|nr:T9SS type A sorting domain-containing protein [Candidatus Neomarinimicrobiota bacterium]
CGVCNGNGDVIWYKDEDGDGYGNIDSPSEPSCLPAIGYVANNLDPDDTCENNHLNYDCNNECYNDSDGDNICDETDDYPNCTSNIVDCAQICDGLAEVDICGVCNGDGILSGTCNCDGDLSSEFYNCDETCINDVDSDSVCDELEISGCTDSEAQNYNANATDEDDSCEYLSINLAEIPKMFDIQSVHPNPFNPIVTITYGVPTSQNIEGYIYNLSGELVHTLISQYQSAGNYSIKWNATGKPSGIYIFILKTESEVKSQKLVLLK